MTYLYDFLFCTASVEKPPLVTNISPPGSCSEDSGADESPSQKSERLPSTSVDASERPPSGMDSWSTEQPEAKSTEKGKEDQETPEDITKQVQCRSMEQTDIDSGGCFFGMDQLNEIEHQKLMHRNGST